MYADIIFNLNIFEAFTYRIPDDITISLGPGHRILAPFGRRKLTGVIVSIHDKTHRTDCRDIIDVLDDQPLVSDEMLQVTRWISEYYLCPWGQTIQIALPKGLDQHSYICLWPESDQHSYDEILTEKQRELYDIILRDPGNTIKYYQEKFGVGAFHHLIRSLKQKSLVKQVEKISRRKVKTVYDTYVHINDDFPDHISGLRKVDQILAALIELRGQELLLKEFQQQTDLSLPRIKKLVLNNVIQLEQRVKKRKIKFTYKENKKSIRLNTEQLSILTHIKKSLILGKFNVHLIHGVTGSGKTQIYLEAIEQVLEAGKSAIVLIPEISLTPQTVSRFENFFPDKVAVFHSKMSLGQRYDAWRHVADGQYPIVVGPRSALFMPVKDLGIIVVDEEHDGSYKQDGIAPRYHARDVAIYRAKLNDAVVLLGSATPSMESYFNASINKYTLLELSSRIRRIPMPTINIIDMRFKRNKPELSQIFSPVLIEKLKTCFGRGEQAILLQNRRGFASFLQCVACGYIPECPNCSIALTLHTHINSLICHYCGHSTNYTKDCMKCGGTQVKFGGAGTQRVEKELKKIFPQITVMRMDQDTTSIKNAHDKYLNTFRRGQAQVLLGTQMIAKGLDFPKVTLVGVIAAEIGLGLPDFRASERVFQLLTQVAGRAGRDKRIGEVIIQTYQEHHHSILFARQHDFKGFYQQEIQFRTQMNYPPLTRLINIRITADDLTAVINHSRLIAGRLRRVAGDAYDLVGPAPCPLTILNNKYRWQILLKINRTTDPVGRKSKEKIKRFLSDYLRSVQKELKVVVDVDPVEML